MVDKLPLISVYMPTKNRGPLLSRAIDSVLAQDYPNFELVVVDDGSTDDTEQVLKQYQQNSQRVRYFRHESSQGAAAARNLAIRESKGKFVTGIDDDDWFLPHRLSSMYQAYDDKFAFICTAVVWDFGQVNGRHKRKLADSTAMVFGLRQQLSYNHATTQVLVERERMLAIDGFDTELVARIDYDGWTRLIERFGNAKRISDASYVLSRDAGVSRITNRASNIKGNHQFMAKHGHLMDKANQLNQQFWDMYAQNSPMSVGVLVKQLSAGYAWLKFKYFIRTSILPFFSSKWR